MTTLEEDKSCPIIYAGLISKEHSDDVKEAGYAKCLREKCEWYGNGCPAYLTQLEIDIYKQDKEFYKELEERNVKSD